MSSIQLELRDLTIHRPKRRWYLYFVLALEDPNDPDRMLVTAAPSQNIRITSRSSNRHSFVPQGSGAEGLVLLRRSLPPTKTVHARLWLRHSRRNVRSAGRFLAGLHEQVSGEGSEAWIMGPVDPWMSITRGVIGGFGGLAHEIGTIGDRDLGMVNLDETFGGEFVPGRDVLRKQKLSTGDATLTWSWTMDAEVSANDQTCRSA